MIVFVCIASLQQEQGGHRPFVLSQKINKNNIFHKAEVFWPEDLTVCAVADMAWPFCKDV